MRKKLTGIVATMAATALVLSACGGNGRGDGDDAPTDDAPGTETEEVEGDGEGEASGDGFAEDALIGISLPWLGTQNWSEAQDMFTEQLNDAGFEVLVQAADNRAAIQQQQIEAMIEQGAEVIVVGPVDGTQLGTVLETAKDAGVYIFGYDRLIENTDAVDGIVQFGSIETGRLQGQALLDGLAEHKGEPPYNIELFGGGPLDPNAPNFFTGAMEILQPEIDAGNLVVVSGQTEFAQAATQDWDNGRAQTRMDSLLSGFYADEDIHGVLSPNDGIARAIITASEDAGQEIPVVSGLDAEDESISWIWDDRQYSTVAKPTNDLVAKTVELIQILQAGGELPAPDETADNGVKEVAVYALAPTVVTKDNIEAFFADDEARSALLN